MRTRFTSIRRSIALGACVLLTAGCFGGGGSGNDPDVSEYTTMDEDPGDPKPGGTLVLTVAADAKSLDVHKQSSYTTHGVVGMVYSKLVDYKSGPGIDKIEELEGDLAEKWEASEDGMEWTFHLRKGVKFHNVAPVNGREFTSADVKCTMDRVQAEGFQKYLLNPVASIEYPDDYTVVFHMKSPFAAFDHNMGNHFMEILPCEATNGGYDINTTAIGTGPFILQSWNRDVERIYVKHPEYYKEGKPYLDGVRWIVMQDAQAQMAALRAGKIDYLSSGSADKRQIDQLVKQLEGAIVTTDTTTGYQQLYMNQTQPPFDNPKVRRAVALAIDREGMLKAMRPGGELSGPVGYVLPDALSPAEVKKLQPYDPEESKKLLAEAGYPDGFETTLMVTTGYGEINVQEAQWVQEDLGKVGIKVTLDVQEYVAYFTDNWPNKKYQMGFGPQTPMLSADEYLSAVFPTNGSRNWYGFDDPQLNKMIEDQRTILDKAERTKKLKEIQEYVITEVSNPVVMYTQDTIVVYSPRVRDFWTVPEYTRRYWENAWVTDGK